MKESSDPMNHGFHGVSRHGPTVEEPGVDRIGGETVEGNRHHEGDGNVEDIVPNLLAHASVHTRRASGKTTLLFPRSDSSVWIPGRDPLSPLFASDPGKAHWICHK